MGTINYGRNSTNEGLLNIGLNLNRFRSPITIMRHIEAMQEIVDDYNGTWFKVNVEPGYYEAHGFLSNGMKIYSSITGFVLGKRCAQK